MSHDRISKISTRDHRDDKDWNEIYYANILDGKLMFITRVKPHMHMPV